MTNNITKLLAAFNAITYTGLGFQAMDYSHTAVLFLVVPITILSVIIMLKD